MFIARNVEVSSCEVRKDKHIFAKFASNGRFFRAKAWNFADRASDLQPGSIVDIAFCIEDDDYSAQRGYSPWQIMLRDVKPVAA